MLSRIAESLYWIGRYIERAEDTARMIDVTFHHTLGMGLSAQEVGRRRQHWEALVVIAGDVPLFTQRYGEANDDTVLDYFTFDLENPNSIVSSVTRARELARALRHQIASEMWEELNAFYLNLHRKRTETLRATNERHPDHVNLFCHSVKEFSHLFQGVTDSTLPRDEGWHFLQAGRFLERASKTARALNVKYTLLSVAAPAPDRANENGIEAARDAVPGDRRQWQALLRSFSAYEAYHKLYRTAVRPESIVDLMLLSPIFPRSIRFSVGAVDEALARIAGEQVGGAHEHEFSQETGSEWSCEAERTIGRLRSMLAFATTEEVLASGLTRYLDDVETRCRITADQIHAQFFAPRILRAEDVVA